MPCNRIHFTRFPSYSNNSESTAWYLRDDRISIGMGSGIQCSTSVLPASRIVLVMSRSCSAFSTSASSSPTDWPLRTIFVSLYAYKRLDFIFIYLFTQLSAKRQ